MEVVTDGNKGVSSGILILCCCCGDENSTKGGSGGVDSAVVVLGDRGSGDAINKKHLDINMCIDK